MSDLSLTIRQIEEIFQKLTLLMLGYDDTDANGQFVRVSWIADGQPAFEITDDVAFVRCIEVDDPVNRQREITYEEVVSPEGLTASMKSTRVMNCAWTFYGATSFDNAQMVRDKLFQQYYHDILAAQNLYMVLDVKSPRRIPELISGKWRERVDFSADFNEGVIRQDTVGYIKSALIEVDSKTQHREIPITE